MTLWNRTVAFFSRREPATAMAWVRIATALCVFLTIGTVVSHDLVDVIWLDRSVGGISDLRGNWLVRTLGGANPTVVTRLIWANFAVAFFLLIGLGGRFTAFLSLQLFMALADINGRAGGSYDELLSNALWLCVLAPNSHTWAVDAKIRTGRFIDDSEVPAWPRFLMIFQLILMYFSTGLQKVSFYWTPGGDFSALYYILQQPSWHRFDMQWIAWLYPLTQLATAVTWFWEVLAPLWFVALWYAMTPERPGKLREISNRYKLAWVYAGIGMFFHVAIFIFMDVGPFSFVSLAYYPALLATYEVRWITDKLGLPSPQAPAADPTPIERKTNA